MPLLLFFFMLLLALHLFIILLVGYHQHDLGVRWSVIVSTVSSMTISNTNTGDGAQAQQPYEGIWNICEKFHFLMLNND
jgi:hypothetical protein